MSAAREELFEALMPVYRAQYAPGEEDSTNALIDAYRAEVLRGAHDAIRADLAKLPAAPMWSPGMSYQQGMDWAARIVDRMAEAGGAP